MSMGGGTYGTIANYRPNDEVGAASNNKPRPKYRH